MRALFLVTLYFDSVIRMSLNLNQKITLWVSKLSSSLIVSKQGLCGYGNL